jgi:hypothetical protein
MSPAGPDQPQGPIVGAHNLDMLQSMLNLVLISSGRFIKEHQSGGGTGKMQTALQHAAPIASERFHDALDELENEVRLAQTVLRRDLALMKQEKKRKEQALKERAEKARMATEPKSAGNEVQKVSTPLTPPAPVENGPEKTQEPEKPLEREAERAAPPSIDTTAAPPPERDPLFDETPTTANPHDDGGLDFDAMFADPMETTGDGVNDDLDMMDTSGDLGFTFDEGPVLLPGLEDFANAKGTDVDKNAQASTTVDLDIAMADLPDPAAVTKAPVDQPATTTAPVPAPAPADTPKPETNSEDVMGDLVVDDLDDLFNMDDYDENANPEHSEFEKAWFNFDD